MIKYIASFCDFVRRAYHKFITPVFYKSRLGFCGKNVNFRNTKPCPTKVLSHVFLHDNTSLSNFTMISAGGNFIMKKGAGAATNLTVITGNHQRVKGIPFLKISASHQYDIEKDVVVEEDVWIGANVTLLSGITVGRGATVGAGSVCVKSIPPYAIVMGNPAKVVGFTFTPDEILEHEQALYQEDDRFPLAFLQKNYEKYFISRVKEIKQFTKI